MHIRKLITYKYNRKLNGCQTANTIQNIGFFSPLKANIYILLRKKEIYLTARFQSRFFKEKKNRIFKNICNFIFHTKTCQMLFSYLLQNKMQEHSNICTNIMLILFFKTKYKLISPETKIQYKSKLLSQKNLEFSESFCKRHLNIGNKKMILPSQFLLTVGQCLCDSLQSQRAGSQW